MFQLQRDTFQNPTNYTLAVGAELLAPLLRLTAQFLIPAKPVAPQQWRRCLILGDNHIGDTLYRTCSLPALKRGLPDCDFYYLTTSSSAPLLEHNPHLKAVLPFSRSDFSGDVHPADWCQLQQLAFDAALVTNPIKYWPDLLFALRLKIPNRAAYIHKGFSGLITHPIHLDFPQPFPAYFRDFVAQLTQQPPAWELQPEIYPTSQDRQEAEIFYQSLNLPAKTPLLACFITSRQSMADWGVDNYAATLNQLYRQCGLIPILLGAKNDTEKLAALKSKLSCPSHMEAGNLSLRALVEFLKKCRLTFCIDSGPRHLSNTARIPVCFFRHLAYHAVESGPYHSGEHDLCPSASYCHHQQQQQILSTIQPAAVINAIDNTR